MQKIVDRKPSVRNGEVVATERGWEAVYENGKTELLVAAEGLLSFIESNKTVVQEVLTEEVVEEKTEEKPKRGRKASE